MNRGHEDFDLSYSEDKTGKNGFKVARRMSRPKATVAGKRNREPENLFPSDSSTFKRVKASNTSNLERDQDFPEENKGGVTHQNQQLIKEYNNMKRVYEEERVNQQSHLYLRRIAHDKTKQNPEMAKYPFLHYLVNASKIMMLNEYEIIAWALWLDSISLEDDEYTLEEKTLFTALYVKN